MTDDNFTYDDFVKFADVPRGTYDQFAIYVVLLRKWQQKINLISDNTVSEIWIRHIIDSIQLFNFLKKSDAILDIGSGAGFPGLVLAILGYNVTLVESDMRKAAFLREAARVTKVNVAVFSRRIEEVAMEGFNILTARAFSSIKNLLDVLVSRITPSQKLLLLKGKGYVEEIKEAQSGYDFDYTTTPSVTGGEGVVLTLSNIIKRSKIHEQYA